jgi:hypothetical protein
LPLYPSLNFSFSTCRLPTTYHGQNWGTFLAVQLEEIKVRRGYLDLQTAKAAAYFSFEFNLASSLYALTAKQVNGTASWTMKSIELSNSRRRTGGKREGGRIMMPELTKIIWSFTSGYNN